MKRTLQIVTLCLFLSPELAQAGSNRDFDAGSLIIPMDLSYQDKGMFQAYGLLFQLLRQKIAVFWIIEKNKTWHQGPCNAPSNECAWDCRDEGSHIKCPYPTASPDFFASAKVIWDGEGAMSAGDPVPLHGYRGGPFVIDSVDRDRALPIIAAWNDPSTWNANPWANRGTFRVVTVHEATAKFTGYVRKEMVAAPTIAVFADGNESIAISYLRAAGIKQSNGNEFPQTKCGANNCGPGTGNPDLLSVPSIMGDMGTCDNPNRNHKNGALFTSDGVPAFCQIMSMHWGVALRETVECDGGACPATQAQCTGKAFTYHGHEVVAEVREFLQYPVHFFAECQAVNAYENTVPNPAWPYLDDPDRNGHFLTTTGNPPSCVADGDCTGTDAAYQCAKSWCDIGTRDCCQAADERALGAGFLIATQPTDDLLKVLHPEVPYNQLDGAFGTVGGSEPAYNLSSYLETTYKNDLEVTFISGANGPGFQDVWMTGYLDGDCSITCDDDANPDCQQSGTNCQMGKVSYLGGHAYTTAVPLSSSPQSQGTRLFLNALFEADCVTTLGQPVVSIDLQGDVALRTSTFPVEGSYTVSVHNSGPGAALDVKISLAPPAGVSVVAFEPDGSEVGGGIEWALGSLGSTPGQPGNPPSSGSRWAKLSFPGQGEVELQAQVEYLVGATRFTAGPVSLTVRAGPDVEAPQGGEDAGIDGGGSYDGGSDNGGSDADGDNQGSADCGCNSRASGAGAWWMVFAIFCLFVLNRRRQSPAICHLPRGRKPTAE